MKKLLSSLATVVLVGGSASSVTAFTQMHQQTVAKVQPQPKHQLGAGVVNPYAIANKLRKHTIKLDPNVWLGRNTKDFGSQINAIVVKDGILTQDEAQYVTWSSVNLTVAGWYWTVNFTVTVPGATATDNVCLDVDSGETTAQIGSKLAKAPNIHFNYNYWNNKDFGTNLAEIRNIFVTENILTKVEASTISGLLTPTKVTQAGIMKVGFHINDNNTDTDTYTNINVRNDGESAQQLASNIGGGDVYRLKTDAQGLYADSNVGGVLDNIRQQLVYYGKYNNDQVQYIWPPHQKLQDDNKNFVFSVIKDGQTVKTTPCEILAHTYANMTRDVNGDGYFQVSANLTPHIVNMLWNYYQTGPSANFFLGYFYQMLNNGGFQQWWDIPSGAVLPQSFQSGDTLGALMSDFWHLNFDSATDAISWYCDTSNSSVASFYNDLSSAVEQAYATGIGMGVYFLLETGHGVGPNIARYSFW